MSRADWIWMGHPAHFCGRFKCFFRLATYIPASNVIVSTVGDWRSQGQEAAAEEIGAGRLFETMVWMARPQTEAGDDPCCPHEIDGDDPLDTLPATTGAEAARNHEALCRRWDGVRVRKGRAPDA